MPAHLAPAQVARWRRDWEMMMRHYQPGRDDLVAAGLATAEATLGRPPRRVLDIGGGPGTTADVVLAHWPAARVTVLDADPALLALAEAALPDRACTVRADITAPGWRDLIRDPYDLVLSVMTVHYLPEVRLQRWYAEVREALRPGGLLLIGETMPDDPTAGRQQEGTSGEDPWGDWWRQLASVASMRPLLHERVAVLADLPCAEFMAPAEWHRETALRAGFMDAATIWRHGDQTLMAFRTAAGAS